MYTNFQQVPEGIAKALIEKYRSSVVKYTTGGQEEDDLNFLAGVKDAAMAVGVDSADLEMTWYEPVMVRVTCPGCKSSVSGPYSPILLEELATDKFGTLYADEMCDDCKREHLSEIDV